MTEEMKEKNSARFLVVDISDGGTLEVCAEAPSPEAARAEAEKLAADTEGHTFGVYQKIGTARLEPKVVWKGAVA